MLQPLGRPPAETEVLKEDELCFLPLSAYCNRFLSWYLWSTSHLSRHYSQPAICYSRRDFPEPHAQFHIGSHFHYRRLKVSNQNGERIRELHWLTSDVRSILGSISWQLATGENFTRKHTSTTGTLKRASSGFVFL